MTRGPLLLLLGCISSASATTYSITSYYAGAARNATPYFVLVEESSECAIEMRAVGDDSDKTLVECSTDYVASVGKQFGSSPYILQVQFDSSECTKFSSGVGVPVSAKGEGCSDLSFTNSSIGRLTVIGSATIDWFFQPQCQETSWFQRDSVDVKTLKIHSCDVNWRKWYSSSDTRRLTTTSESSGAGVVTPDVGSTSTSTSASENTDPTSDTTANSAPSRAMEAQAMDPFRYRTRLVAVSALV
ncbi:hypothetical protein GN958_ATG09991 [Phytophthora infestans]|uniref:Uncharacterized protein n=1 Tax=Phytophthora infestans TaxID=4787 RepID=A0A8S9URB4_PHYIN|nr:hypothetical protein GN958_ATG09991 [Phytophthora infestans]